MKPTIGSPLNIILCRKPNDHPDTEKAERLSDDTSALSAFLICSYGFHAQPFTASPSIYRVNPFWMTLFRSPSIEVT